MNNVPYTLGRIKYAYTYLENTLKYQAIKESLLAAVPSLIGRKMSCLQASLLLGSMSYKQLTRCLQDIQ